MNLNTLEELKVIIRCEIDCISKIELIRVNACFLKRCQICVDEGVQHFQHLMLQGTWLFFFVILLNCRKPCSGSIAFDLPTGTWANSGCHRQLPCCGWHLSKRHCVYEVYVHFVLNTGVQESELFHCQDRDEWRHIWNRPSKRRAR